MTVNERKKIAEDIFNSLENLLINLFSRWKDEHKFENINEYCEPIKKYIPKEATFIKMNKKPFGFNFKLSDATYQVFISSNQYGYKRIN